MARVNWKGSPGSNDYANPSNWSTGTVPTSLDVAVFGRSTMIYLTTPGFEVDASAWIFKRGVSQYSFTTSMGDVSFFGGGIIVRGGSVDITILLGTNFNFYNNATAGSAAIAVAHGTLNFFDMSTAGRASIIDGDSAPVTFYGHSTGGQARIETQIGAAMFFQDFSTGGHAQLVADAASTIDFSPSAGPAGNHALTAGSIAGKGTFELGENQLTVGGNGRSTNVGGLIDGPSGGLVKAGRGTLTLSHADNTFGDLILKAGAVDLAVAGAAGLGFIEFSGEARLKIDEAALSGHALSNPIYGVRAHDVIDLTGLKFRAGETATYQRSTGILSVHSGHATDTLTLLSPHGTHFEATSDGHGGTDVFLLFA
jgi:autotransporter-associated beta strand protein